jgi:hypothetical protein
VVKIFVPEATVMNESSVTTVVLALSVTLPEAATRTLCSEASISNGRTKVNASY